jgi:hypothetical protein
MWYRLVHNFLRQHRQDILKKKYRNIQHEWFKMVGDCANNSIEEDEKGHLRLWRE